MTAKELRQKYLDFFVKKGHKIIPSAPLVPEHDPTVLFTTAGMHPLVPYLLGEPHPLGRRLVSNQRCLRTGDIDSVGDAWHITFFEMLGNWSLGDYWKEEAIRWSKEFLTKELGISLERISVTVFRGDAEIPSDEESIKIWQKEGIPKERIYLLGKADNFWGPVGNSGPCGPCTEMFYDTGKAKCDPGCQPGCYCGKYAEIWNDVFMEYNKTKEGEYKTLKQRNVDTGMGVERTTAVLQGKDNVYDTELFTPMIYIIGVVAGKSYQGEFKKSFRIIADHLKAATFLIADGVEPSNVERGYVLRRLIRRAIRHGRLLGINSQFTPQIAEVMVENYRDVYSEISKNQGKIGKIKNILMVEEEKFSKTLTYGLKEFEKLVLMFQNIYTIPGEKAFYLYESFGFPIELTNELAQERGLKVDMEGFERALTKHQELSRTASAGMFKGGLADHSEEVTKLHTATHLLHASLRKILGEHVQQKGSNITAERLRFDFLHPWKFTEEEIRKIEELVNQKITENLPVTMEIMDLGSAKKSGALGFFTEKYGEKVKVYTIGNFSKEVCGGPHVDFTGKLGRFKIVKEEAAGAGLRRIYGNLNPV